MKIVRVRLRDDVHASLVRAARDNGRSLKYEIACRIGESESTAAKARRAKIAVLAATLESARELARVHGWKRCDWFYAHSVDAVTGRLVRRIEIAASYRIGRNHKALMTQLRGGELAAKAFSAQ